MKVFTMPKVILIARPSIVWENVEKFLEEETGLPRTEGWVQEDGGSPEDSGLIKDGDSLPEFCGRMCYRSFGKKQGKKTNKGYIANIVQQGHGSVLEHSNWSFLVSQCSRGFTHEIVRHRSGFAYSQESTHYIDYSDPANWSICIDRRLADIFPDYAANMEAAAEDCFRTYARVHKALMESGLPKKEASSISRQILPNGMESKITFTANARALRHFVEYRGHDGNVLEIRTVAKQVLEIMKVEAPAIFDDITLALGPDGIDVVQSLHRKV